MRSTSWMIIALATITFSGTATAATLVSNLEEPQSSGYECNYGNWWASPFETDGQDWYLLSVTLSLQPVVTSNNSPLAWIYDDDGNGKPGTRIAALVNPVLPIGIAGEYQFVASPLIRLDPNTRYHVAVGTENPLQKCRWYYTTSTSYTGLGTKPFLAYIDTGHDFDWNYTRNHYTMLFEVEVELEAVPTEQTSWGTIKRLFSE